MKTLLMIGGTGFIGREIIKSLNPKDFRVLVLSSLNKAANEMRSHNKDSEIKIFIGQLVDTDLIESIITDHKVDIVIHLASSLVPISTIDEYNLELENIIYPTIKLINKLANHGIKLIYFSSGGNIYKQTSDHIHELSETEINNFYAKSKLMIESAIISKSKEIQPFNYLILRPSHVYGRTNRINIKQGFIENTILRITQNKPIAIWGDGKQTRDYIHISDLVKILKVIGLESTTHGILNVASGNSINLLDIVKIIMATIGHETEIVFDDKVYFGPKEIKFNISNLEQLINFQPVQIEAGIKKLISQLNG